jgi:D-alanyl-D-alanine carboxypeptidase
VEAWSHVLEIAGVGWYQGRTTVWGALFFVLVLRRLVLLALFLISAGAARANPMLLVDLQTTEVLYAEEAGQPWHPASLTKLMTAYVAFAAVRAGRLTLDSPIRISPNAWGQAPSKSPLDVDSTVTLRDALYIMVVKSANDIAVAIAEAVSGSESGFVAEMNDMAGAMGLTATHFVNPHGLHDEAQVTTARDLAVLALHIQRDYPEYLPMFATAAVTIGQSTLETNNELLNHFQGTTGMKTGYVCASGLNIVATVERQGRSFLAVVLGGSSARERNEMAAELVLKALRGDVRGSGQSVVQIANKAVAPVNMRPLICGKEAKAYVAQREAEFPIGLEGQPTYLEEEFDGPVYTATDLGRTRNVPLPRRRPFLVTDSAALN